MISSPMASRKAARASGVVSRKASKASAARAQARDTSASPAKAKAGSSVSPDAGSTALNVAARPDSRSEPITMSPVNAMVSFLAAGRSRRGPPAIAAMS